MKKSLEDILHGASIRAIAAIHDVGEVTLAYFRDPDGGKVYQIDENLKDIWVTLQAAMSDTPTGKIVARLFTPLNMMFRLPKAEESSVVVRGADVDGPGTAYAMYGDCGADNQVPDWLDEENAGISVDEQLHIQSKSNGVQIDAADDKDVTLHGGTLPAARKTDPVYLGKMTAQAGPFPVIFTLVRPTVDDGEVSPPDGEVTAGPNVDLGGFITEGADHVKS